MLGYKFICNIFIKRTHTINRYFVCNTFLGASVDASGKRTGSMPAVANLNHFTLAPNGVVADYYGEVHSYASNKQLSQVAVGPNGPVYRPTPTTVNINPKWIMSWSITPDQSLLTITVGAIKYYWKLAGDPNDPERYECQPFYQGQFSGGFGYFSDTLVSPKITSIEPDYAGEQLQSAGGIWHVTSERRGAGLSTYLYSKTSNPNILTFSQPANDGTNLRDLGSIAFNSIIHSNQMVAVYGGHDYNGDGQESILDGGHCYVAFMVNRGGKMG